MKNAIGVIFFSLFFIGKIFGQECPVKSGFADNRFSAYYKHREYVKSVENIEQIPLFIKEKLFFHLTKKLGSEFTRKLNFDWGEYLDIENLKKDNSNLYKENRRLGTAFFNFHYSDKSKGLKSYAVIIALNENGSLAEEIYLPDIFKNPSKGKIISCNEALQIAERKGFTQKSYVGFEYSYKHKSFIWIVDRAIPIEKPLAIGQGLFERLEMDANSGLILKVWKYSIVI